MESIEITDRAASQIARGLLWIYSNEIYKKPATFAPGSLCTFHCRSKIIATGYANPHSLIFGRVLAFDAQADIAPHLEKQLLAAFARRPNVGPKEAARLVYSEADFLPGLVLDLYADALVLQSNTAGIDNLLPQLETILPKIFKAHVGRELKAFVIKADSGIRRLEQVDDFSKILLGEKSSLENWEFEEGGTRFGANLLEGQKTGFFLDQRDNRTYLTGLMKLGKKRVLDLFSYSGGWGLRALTNGAEHVTFVDESVDALKLVERGLKLNQISASKARLVQSDVFKFLESHSELYDVVVSDPPAFVKSKKNLPQAIKAYEKLNRLVWRLLEKNGTLISCSCSYHLSESDFYELLQTAIAKEKGMAHIVFHGGQALDHPVLLSMPETRYLKCLALKKLDVFSN